MSLVPPLWRLSQVDSETRMSSPCQDSSGMSGRNGSYLAPVRTLVAGPGQGQLRVICLMTASNLPSDGTRVPTTLPDLFL